MVWYHRTANHQLGRIIQRMVLWLQYGTFDTVLQITNLEESSNGWYCGCSTVPTIKENKRSTCTYSCTDLLISMKKAQYRYVLLFRSRSDQFIASLAQLS
jgi:hypothetical protein